MKSNKKYIISNGKQYVSFSSKEAIAFTYGKEEAFVYDTYGKARYAKKIVEQFFPTSLKIEAI